MGLSEVGEVTFTCPGAVEAYDRNSGTAMQAHATAKLRGTRHRWSRSAMATEHGVWRAFLGVCFRRLSSPHLLPSCLCEDGLVTTAGMCACPARLHPTDTNKKSSAAAGRWGVSKGAHADGETNGDTRHFEAG